MNIQNKTVLITGANRGIGRALVEEALRRGAKRVYAGTRGAFQHSDKRVTPLTLDVTNPEQIQRAVESVESLHILINNAGIAIYDDLSNLEAIEKHLAVNFLGLLKVTHAFLPQLKRSKGAIVNNLLLAGLAALPMIPSYSISKAAAFNLTQSLRALLASQGVSVHAVVLGPHRHRCEPRFRNSEGFDRLCGAGHLRWPGKRRRGDIPRSRVPVHRRGLADWSTQGARTAVRSFRAGCRTTEPNRRRGPGSPARPASRNRLCSSVTHIEAALQPMLSHRGGARCVHSVWEPWG
jgi:NAD(P)-dependent dehydrogenase (short-subunit alcohol dehydrogenase family)